MTTTAELRGLVMEAKKSGVCIKSEWLFLLEAFVRIEALEERLEPSVSAHPDAPRDGLSVAHVADMGKEEAN